ncbi:enamine deaminase RidA (YjgF/YER057c/UK114 family) [Prauserella shujinwangii]|uniref:Enamine deaminase RidA (YjgF/YER057c/UK114 family) n=1 Tax=Prauserella shujinwangii TaxID=1453103 RepID=A0A2T0LKG5_9PSEU|nr:RidA family protein [Prauserella shujinwangii]PRX43396.1 enamine deaminase RidA (YjgF/YER057c/UK114 family) [Prauserella shujinwangii]
MTTPTTAAERLSALGLELPPPPVPVAAFEPYVRAGDTVYVSGQIATRDGALVADGVLGAGLDVEAGQDAARACALNVLAQLAAAAGGLDAVTRLVRVTVFVASTPDFTRHPQVADGASQLFRDVLGPAGAHARAAVGVASLPLGTPVEVDAVAILDPERAAA